MSGPFLVFMPFRTVSEKGRLSFRNEQADQVDIII